MVMNAAPLQHFERWDIHAEGTQPAVRAVTDRLDLERIAVREALGWGAPHYPLADHYANDRWMYGDAHRQLVKSGDWREHIDLHTHRYITEDTELGLAFLASVARYAGVDAPIAHGLLAIVGGFLGRDLRQGPRTLRGARPGRPVAGGRLTAAALHDGADATPLPPIRASPPSAPAAWGAASRSPSPRPGHRIALVDLRARSRRRLAAPARRGAGRDRRQPAEAWRSSARCAPTQVEPSPRACESCGPPTRRGAGRRRAGVRRRARAHRRQARGVRARLNRHCARRRRSSPRRRAASWSRSSPRWCAGPERFLNMHWLNPAYVIPVVELSAHAGTGAGGARAHAAR